VGKKKGRGGGRGGRGDATSIETEYSYLNPFFGHVHKPELDRPSSLFLNN
jgi:hypothetical protein